MDRLLQFRPPKPTSTAAAADGDGDLLELDVLCPPGLLAVLPEDEGKRRKKRGGIGRVAVRSAARPIPETAASNPSMAKSAPVRIPSEAAAAARRGNWGHSIEDDGEAAMVVPPHEIVARRAAAAAHHSSVLEGSGRTLKGRDLRRVRNAVLRRTGFLD
uniref:Uncharacterized protein n=1 Tax=Leersia perrieri TaxID=77586 RepID=A0A0D9XP66_9ORYZ